MVIIIAANRKTVEGGLNFVGRYKFARILERAAYVAASVIQREIRRRSHLVARSSGGCCPGSGKSRRAPRKRSAAWREHS